MKVTVTLVIDVDTDAWVETYGTETTAAAIRADVKRHVLNTVDQQLADIECGTAQIKN